MNKKKRTEYVILSILRFIVFCWYGYIFTGIFDERKSFNIFYDFTCSGIEKPRLISQLIIIVAAGVLLSLFFCLLEKKAFTGERKIVTLFAACLIFPLILPFFTALEAYNKTLYYRILSTPGTNNLILFLFMFVAWIVYLFHLLSRIAGRKEEEYTRAIDTLTENEEMVRKQIEIQKNQTALIMSEIREYSELVLNNPAASPELKKYLKEIIKEGAEFQ